MKNDVNRASIARKRNSIPRFGGFALSIIQACMPKNKVRHSARLIKALLYALVESNLASNGEFRDKQAISWRMTLAALP